MGGSAEAPTLPDAHPVRGLRASDTERDQVVAKLTEEYAAGRLSHETFLFRMHAVLESRHQSDLPRVLADLPPAPDPAPGSASPGAPSGAASGAAPAAHGPGTPAMPAAGLPAGRRGLAGRLRAAMPRLPGAGATFSGESAHWAPSPRNRPARRLTSAMRSAGDAARRPEPLEFPRGTGPMFTIGRNDGCDLAIPDMTVSRMHARLERTPDGWLLTDLGSTNGTRVNGWLVRGYVPVRAGDLVTFGKVDYWLSAAAEGA